MERIRDVLSEAHLVDVEQALLFVIQGGFGNLHLDVAVSSLDPFLALRVPELPEIDSQRDYIAEHVIVGAGVIAEKGCTEVPEAAGPQPVHVFRPHHCAFKTIPNHETPLITRLITRKLYQNKYINQIVRN